MPQRRRARYTVTCSARNSNEVEQKVVLAYDAVGAQNYYVDRGYTVFRVRKGDHVLHADHGGFRIDGAALREAKDFFGLTWPVTVRLNGRRGGKYGHCALRLNADLSPRIEIMVKSYLSPEQASRTLWHELCHAMQYEREARNPSDAYDAAWRLHRANAGITYRAKPIEVEARSYEDFAVEMPLCH